MWCFPKVIFEVLSKLCEPFGYRTVFSNGNKDLVVLKYLNNSCTRVHINPVNLHIFEKLMKNNFKKYKSPNKNFKLMTSALFQKVPNG